MASRNYDKWSEEQDQTLLRLVEENEKQYVSWVGVSAGLRGKSARQCYDRFCYRKRQKTEASGHVWTREETETFLEALGSLKFQWEEM